MVQLNGKIIFESIKDQLEKAYVQDGGSIDEYFVRSANVDKLGYSVKQTFGRSPDIGDDNFSVDYIGYGKGKPALWFYPLSYYLKRVADVAYGNDMPHVWLVRIKPNAWLQPVSNNNVTKQDAPKGKERVGLLRKSAVPAAIFFKPGFDVVDKFYDYGSQHKRHGEVKGVPETIRKVKGGYRLLSKKGKNLGTYPSKSGAENRERQVQYFKHLGEVADSPYAYIQNVKTPDKRAYRFQTDSGQLYRVQVFNRRNGDDNKLEIHFDLTDMSTGKPETGKTGTGDAVRVFSTVAAILQKEVANQDSTGIIIASKADDESRVKLYRTLARRAAKTISGFEISGERTVTGGDGNPYITIELVKK
jgi:hypothetical protein